MADHPTSQQQPFQLVTLYTVSGSVEGREINLLGVATGAAEAWIESIATAARRVWTVKRMMIFANIHSEAFVV